MDSVLTNHRTQTARLIDVPENAPVAERLRALEEEAGQLALLLDLPAIFSSVKELDTLMNLVVEQATRIMHCERSSVFLLDKEHEQLYSLVAQGHEVQELRFSVHSGIASHAAREGVLLNIPDAYQDARFNQELDRITGFRTRSVLAVPLRDRFGLPIGVVQCLNKKGTGGEPAVFSVKDERLLAAVASQAAFYLENTALHQQMDKLFDAFVEATSRSIDDRDACTSGHSRRVMQYALHLARAVHACNQPPFEKITFSRQRLRQLRYAALLHDVGKIGVRENVLSKSYKLNPLNMEVIQLRLAMMRAQSRTDCAFEAAAQGVALEALLASRHEPLRAELDRALKTVQDANQTSFVGDEMFAALEQLKLRAFITESEFRGLSVRRGNLTEDEWADMRSHVTKTHRLLTQIPWPAELKDIPEIAYTHHEKYDGSGYPRQLKGDQIHFDGQILCVADIYDALTASDRPYKKAIPPERAKEILLKDEAGKGKILPELVALFFESGCHHIAHPAGGVLKS